MRRLITLATGKRNRSAKRSRRTGNTCPNSSCCRTQAGATLAGARKIRGLQKMCCRRSVKRVRAVLAEKKIECEMQIVDVVPAENPVNAHNPLGKIPTLVLDDGTALYDSRVIVEFLDQASPLNRLIPADFR